MEESREVLHKLLRYYEAHFDIESPFTVGQAVYDAYGYFCMANTKYVLVKEAQMWRADLFEHIFFKIVDVFTDGELEEYKCRIRGRLEPEFVRKGEKYPIKDHMCTSLTHVFICRQAIQRDVARQVRRHKFRRYYRFALRGYCEGRLVAIDLEKRKIYGNPSARHLVKCYRQLFRQEGIK